MKVLRFLSMVCIGLSSAIFSMAQDASTTVSDEELKKYAIAMDSVERMKASLLTEISELVKNNDKISGARYNELSKIINDETKLAEAKATTDEIAAVKEVLAKKDEGTAKIQQTFQTLAKEYVSAATYNKVKKALTDPEVKTRYETILAEIQKN